MFTAKEDINSYQLGKIKAGSKVEFNQAWFDVGLIEEKPEKTQSLETKPQPKGKTKK